MISIEDFNKTQDTYLITINKLTNFPLDAKYDITRPIKNVSHGIYKEMVYLANKYLHWIKDEVNIDSSIQYDPMWLYKIIEKYYNEI